jgi:Zn-dependent peptidase ImmA (M78 family)
MEEGLVEPRVDSLLRVAEVLGVKADRLVTSARRLEAVRFRAQKKMTTREDLLANVARWLDDYAEVERLVDDAVPFRLASVAKSVKPSPERAIDVAAAARKTLKLTDHEPIRDLSGLLEDHGVKVFKPSVASEGFFGLSVGQADGGPAVVVNCWERISVERWIFTAAHELGHLLLHLDAYDVREQAEDDAQEAEANLFASHFLMPESAFLKEWNEARGMELVDRVFKVKRIFHVSWKSVVFRASLRLPDPSKAWPQFYAAYKRKTGKPLKGVEEPVALDPQVFSSGLAAAPVARIAEEPAHLLPSDFAEDRLLRLVRKGIEGGVLSTSRAADILGLDLRGMRELARTWVE